MKIAAAVVGILLIAFFAWRNDRRLKRDNQRIRDVIARLERENGRVDPFAQGGR